MLRKLFVMALSLLVLAVPALAQSSGASAATDYKPLGLGLAIIGFAVAAGLGALGQGKIGSAALEGTARNPSASGKIQTMMILGLAFIESLVIFALVIVFANVGKF
ncbi:MAG: ATP synthase F0 subunit C [Pyrinomonadaceae bacterium]|jgi:F-type H+-transporting ATPase subunit c|nr:ATP synthase F0 subunit C [Pyrinomonadaceae bacterium]